MSAAITITPQVPTNVTTPASAAPVETAPTQEAAPAAPPAQDPLSPKFAALARKERALRQQMRDLETQTQAIKAREAELQQASAWKERLKTDPYGVMLETGITADQVASLLLNQPNPEDQKFTKLQMEIQALKQQQEAANENFKKTQDQQYEDAKKQIRSDVTILVDGNEAYETIKAMNATEAVVELIEQTFQKDGRLMSVDEAAQEVEDYLVEEATRIARLKKIQTKLTPPVDAGISKQPIGQKQQATTLSNKMGSGRPLSARERAILAFQGKLQ